MADRLGTQTAEPVTFNKLLDTTSKLIAVAGAIVTAALVILKTWGVHDVLLNYLAWSLAAMLVATAAIGWRILDRRQRAAAARAAIERELRDAPLKAGFRGLFSYTRGDTLPGPARQAFARRIANAVTHPSFRYAAVCGDVGAGKSSLLDCGIATPLEQQGFVVEYVRGLQAFRGERELSAVIAGLRAKLADAGAKPVLILDQFEEMLIEWRAPEARQLLGAFLANPLIDKPVRVLCAIRSDYFAALGDLAPALPDPTSSASLYVIKNFDQDEASEIIVECAERDGLVVSKELARTITADLAHGGDVRPPELQLVCQAIGVRDLERRYRERGGAQGILAGYVLEAVRDAPGLQAAPALLRAMCNLETVPPATREAQSIAQLSETIDSSGDSDHARLAQVLGHLAQSRLVEAIEQDGEVRYRLVHDYLVQPIIMATTASSTQAEKANQFLRLHLAEYAADPRSSIPWRRLSFIQRHADRQLLASASSRALLRRSNAKKAALLGGGALVVAIGGIAYGASVLHGFTPAWMQLAEPEASVVLEGGETKVFSRISADRQSVIVWGRANMGYWNVHEASGMQAAGTDPELDQAGNAIALLHGRPDIEFEPTTPLSVFLPRERRVRIMPIKGMRASRYQVSHSGRVVLFDPHNGDQAHVSAWSVADRRMLGRLPFKAFFADNPSDSFALIFRTEARPDPSISVDDVPVSGDVRFPMLWRLFAPIGPDNPRPLVGDVIAEGFVVDGAHEVAVILSRPSKTMEGLAELTVVDLRQGRVVRHRMLSIDWSARLDLAGNGQYLLLRPGGNTTYLGHDPFKIISMTDLNVVQDSIGVVKDRLLDADAPSPSLFAWSDEEGGTFLWNLAGGAAHRVENFGLDNFSAASGNGGSRAVIIRDNGKPELWDTDQGIQVPLDGWPPAISAAEARFTIDGKALAISTGENQYLFDAGTGRLVHRFDTLGNLAQVYYSPECQSAIFWTERGSVIRYALSRKLPWPWGITPVALGCR